MVGRSANAREERTKTPAARRSTGHNRCSESKGGNDFDRLAAFQSGEQERETEHRVRGRVEPELD